VTREADVPLTRAAFLASTNAMRHTEFVKLHSAVGLSPFSLRRLLRIRCILKLARDTSNASIPSDNWYFTRTAESNAKVSSSTWKRDEIKSGARSWHQTGLKLCHNPLEFVLRVVKQHGTILLKLSSAEFIH
jgi:hypothetical protein